MQHNPFLMHEQPLAVLPSLAVAFGSVDRAIILQKFQDWCSINTDLGLESDKIGEEVWVTKTMSDLSDTFAWLTTETIVSHISILMESDLLIVLDAPGAEDKTTCRYRINYDKLKVLEEQM